MCYCLIYSGGWPLLRAIPLLPHDTNCLVQAIGHVQHSKLNSSRLSHVCNGSSIVGTLLAISNSSAANANYASCRLLMDFRVRWHAKSFIADSSFPRWATLIRVYSRNASLRSLSGMRLDLYLIAAPGSARTRPDVAILCGAIVYIGLALCGFHRQGS